MKINNAHNWLKLTLFLSVLCLTTGVQPIKALPGRLDHIIVDDQRRPEDTHDQETPDEVIQPGAIRDPIDGTRTGQGGSRGECDQPDTYNIPPTLIARTSNDAWVTTNSTPRLYVYIPFTLRNRDPGMFTLRSDGGPIVDQQQFLNVPNGGILEISLNQPLQIGQTYEWFFETFCNDHTMSNSTDYSFLMSSFIRREAVGFPGNHLYDQLSLAADRKRQGSSADWDNLLESIGLSHLRDQPIIRQ